MKNFSSFSSSVLYITAIKNNQLIMSQQQDKQPSENKLWGGRFTGATDPLMDLYNASLPYDKVMYDADLTGTKVYTQGLNKLGLITTEELNLIHQGLEQIRQEWHDNKFIIKAGDEDIHTANERRLGEIIGKTFLVKFTLVDQEMIKLLPI